MLRDGKGELVDLLALDYGNGVAADNHLITYFLYGIDSRGYSDEQILDLINELTGEE